MNKYIERLLQFYKEKKIDHETTLSLLESYKTDGKKEEDDCVAIVGLSCQMPMADSKEEFWERLRSRTNCVGPFPLQRRKDTDPLIPLLAHNLHSTENPYWTGGFLSSVDLFDNEFFHILPSEARVADPQQRIFLELAHAAFEDAGCCMANLRGSNTGVFIGDVVNEYRKIVTEVSPLAVIGNVSPFIASRISYFYDLHGPTINVSTTCSTALVAVHLACQSLLIRECDQVLVGAINLRLFPFGFKDDPVDALGITTQDGACYAFDHRANGIVRGEGAGALVLKRLKDAKRDKNHIYALIRSSSVNNDGRSSNVGAPNPLAHEALLKKAWEKARIDPRQVSYIEAHGTGTRIGDPIEVQGIKNAFSHFTQEKQFCGLGSVKTNIGHLTGGAAGLAGLIKTVLALDHEEIPPSLHFERPNELIDFPNTPLFVVDRLMPWPRSQKARIAGVSAFGFNGTNCHVVLEEAPTSERAIRPAAKALPFFFSHRTQSGLEKLLKKYLEFFEGRGAHLPPEDISYTLSQGRDRYPVQLLLFALSVEELIWQLRTLPPGSSTTPKVNWEEVFKNASPRLVSLPTYVFEPKRFWLDVKSWSDDDKIAPALPLEKKVELPLIDQLTGLFQEVMGLEKVHPTDHFLDLGGDSLMGIEIISLIHKRLNKKISYSDLFQNPRINDLAELLQKKQTTLFQGIPPAPVQDVYPLSYGQRRLWILHQMQDHPTAYNIYDAYQFDRPIDLDAFQNALDRLVERHVAFRTIFVEQNGEPYQKIAPLNPFDLTILEVPSLEAAHEKIHAFRNLPFDLEKGPLAKALLLRLSEERSLFFFMMHHIISDGWSIRIIIEELLKLYRGDSLPSLRINTIDYCQWQRGSGTEQRFKELEKFWLDHLASPLPISEISGDKSRPALFNFQGARKSFDLPKEYEEKLSLHGGRENATFFMVLLASVYVLIYRYTGQTDLIIGSPISGRSHADLKPLVGFFVNTLALRCILDPTDSFAKFLTRVKAQTLNYFEHQDYPFDHLIDQLKLERNTSRSPLFNINVAFQNFALDEEAKAALSDLKTTRVELPHNSCKWDLEFEFVKQRDGTLTCFVEYYTGIYSEEMISLLISTYQTLLRSLTEDFQKPIYEIALSPLSYCISGPSAPLSKQCLHELFEEQAARLADHPAIRTADRVISYRELNERANQLAHFLKIEKKLPLEGCVGLYLENSPEAIISILGILKAGGAYVPLDVKAPLERIRFLIEEAKIELLLSKKKQLRALNDLQWSSSLCTSFLCLDSVSIEEEIEENESSFMDVNLWNQVADEGRDEITSSGWVSSYTGAPFSFEEMQEYKANILNKLQPYLHAGCRVLEIGCGSGLSAFTIAPHVGFYLGVDLSSSIIKKNEARAEKIPNLKFACYAAHEIDLLNERNFDLVIINSVIHCFPGQNYLKSVLRKAIDLMASKAAIFLGDLMDASLKESLKLSLSHFKEAHRNEGLRTKLDWNQELFISREFLADLRGELLSITDIKYSKKIGSYENELTRFRFDALLSIDKENSCPVPKKKEQCDLRHLEMHPTQNLNLPLSDRNLAYVLFTSGSTGTPKGVMVEHRSVHNYIQWAIGYYTIDSLKFPLYSSLHFDLTVTSIFAPLFSGGYLCILNGEIDEILESLAKQSDTNILKLTPTHLTMISERRLAPAAIHQFIVGGETLFASQCAEISKFYPSPIWIYNEYGPTEATVGCIVHLWDPAETEGSVLIGEPISNCKIHILDAHLQPVPIGGIGEIVIEGDCLARGYLNHSKAMGSRYHTGDLGRYLPNRKIAYVGRKDRQVKIKGYRIELDEIESRLLQHPSIKSCAVLVRGGALCGYYVASVPPEEVAQFLSQTLPSYMIPPFLTSLEAMPVTRNGKIDASRLPDPERSKKKNSIQPRSIAEKSLHQIWSRVLNIPEKELSIDDDFFDLGGDSIMAMRILPQVREAGNALSIKEIFQYRTIRMLGQKIAKEASAPIPQDEVTGSFSWAPVQHWFWDQKMAHPAYFNMAYLFRISPNIQLERLEAAFEKCFAHHDALRSIYKEGRQEIVPPSELKFQIDQYSLADEAEIVRLTAQIQGSFDPSRAPLLKAAIFELGNGEKRLFLAIHHLIIDGVSWRFLIEDLTKLYSSSLQSPLPPKTCSYKEWVEMLSLLPPLTREEIGVWLDIDPLALPKLSVGPFPTMEETSETFIHLSKEETLTLISKPRSFFDANVNEILLASLGLSIRETFGNDQTLIHHEGHGRHALKNLDISRTVGWFTTIYPILLETDRSLIPTLLRVKETLQRFSRNELFYGVARYLQKHPHLEKFKPEILFNYFGRVDADLMGQLFENSSEKISSTSASANRLPHLIEVNAIIIEDRLRISIVCNNRLFGEGVAASWIASLESHILKYTAEKEKALCQLDSSLSC